MTPAQLAARYRGYAAQCLIVAQRQNSDGDKMALIAMAQAWVTLAEQIESDASVVVLYETPDPERPEDMC